MSTVAALSRQHARRLREVYRSAGWPWQDVLELELLALGLLERQSEGGRDSVRLTDAGIQAVAQSAVRNQRARSAHELLVERVAREQGRAGRIVWRGLALRALLPAAAADAAPTWCVACPDVFSIRNTSVASYVEPVVHEIKVSRADLLGDLRKPAKRQAYLDLGGQCWYVLGRDARGRAIGDADDVPAECGVLAEDADGLLAVQRNALRRERAALPFHVWMALARATPCAGLDEGVQQALRAE
ncbi:hypothetical protein [Pseudorhodoferax sp.]|uniref:hypothetical protein n=1 Tax=Pseudorhodoferax sp. TaxID=1993553 RepID=UPI002DD64FA0|nr:hypothetical protein [Pseudorhodoferax sp.]